MFRSCLFVLLACALFAGESAPYGSKDFYPSPERPIGFCGDGNGWYPGATPVTGFWDGTPTKTTMKMHDKRKGMVDQEVWDLADTKSKNIAWKTRMPAWSNSQPIVVGDRVLSLYEPYGLVCCDANSGEILWTVEANPWLCAGADPATAEWAHRMFAVYRALPYFPYMKDHTLTQALKPNQWEEMTDLLEQKVLPNILAELKRIDPDQDYAEAVKQTVAGCRAQIAAMQQADAKKAPTIGKDGMALHDAIKRRVEGRTGKWMGSPREEGKLRWKSSWGYEVGNMAAPVSDGRYVYFESQYGSTMCVDLNGKLVWGKWFSNTNRCNCQSPLLADSVLISMHGVSTLRGLDAKTGEVKWTVPTKGASVKSNKGGYYVGNHKIVPLDAGGATRRVLVTTMCNIIDPDDGKVLGELPWPYDYGPSGGPSVVNSGDIVIRSANGDGGSSPLVAYRLKFEGSDQVVTEKLWEQGPRCSPGYSQLVATDGFFVFDGGGKAKVPNVADPATGEPIFGGFGGDRIGGLSDMLAGKVYFWAEEGNRGDLADWKNRRSDGKALGLIYTADCSDPKSPKKVGSNNLLGGSDWPALPAMERLTPELWALPWYHSSSWGKPSHRLHADNVITCQGNRVFVRTMSDLYAIGDPGMKYDWNPASRPADIAKSLK